MSKFVRSRTALGAALLCSFWGGSSQAQSPEPPAKDTVGSDQSNPAESEAPPTEKERRPDDDAALENSETAEVADADDFAFDDEDLEYGATAEVEAPPREPTKHSLQQEELTTIPGTRGDALRAVEVLPGVARTQFAGSDGPPMIRGSSSGDSKVLLDGAEVPLLYHFGGLTSFYNSHLLERVDFYPGNFSARYGRASGGIIEARVRDPRSDGVHAMLELSLIDNFALIEAPLGESTSMAIAARRSNIDFVFESLVPDGTYQVVAAPVYYDYQAIVAHRLDRRHKLRVLAYGSHDQLKLVFDDPPAEEPAIRGEIEGLLAFHRGQIELDSEFSDVVHQRLMVSVGPQRLEQKLGGLTGNLDALDALGRAEWSIFASPELRLDLGVDVATSFLEGSYNGPAPGQDEGVPDGNLSTEEFVELEDRIETVRPAAYVELSYRPVPELLLVPGIRADYEGTAEEWTVDPRLSARVSVDDATTVKGGVGVFSQPPVYFEQMELIGNPEVEPQSTHQMSLGVERRFPHEVDLSLEGFYKRFYNRIVATEGSAPPRFENDGSGRAYGLEFLGTARPAPRTTAFVSYTLSRSERRDRNEAWRLFDHDQTHNLSLAANYDLGSGWLVGARFRYVTGDPTTPVEGAVYDANSDTYQAVYGGVNTARRPAFHQLDVRAEKQWAVGPGAITAYLEVFNVYNAQNIEGESYSYDFSRSEGVSGMPIFPNLGLRGEF